MNTASRIVLALVAAFCAASCALSHRARGDAALDITMADGDAGRIDGDVVVNPDVPIAPDGDAGCPTGTVRCGGTCVAIDVPQRCGSCTNDCTALSGVSAAAVHCTSGACDLTNACQADLADCDHDAANGCETSLGDSANCGACGVACSGTTPVCSRASSTSPYACSSGCPAGTMRCPSGTCADVANDRMNCGSCGMVCSAPSGATASCSGGSCSWTCDPGSHMCGSQCIADTSTDGCGTSCTPCPTDPNGTATCDGAGMCGITCASGFHICSGACVSSSLPSSCGSSCTPCPVPSNASATCAGGTCGSRCNTGYHDCSGTCSADTSPSSCGTTSCTPCSAPMNATATCTGGTCGFTCNGGFTLVAGACVPMTCGNQTLDPLETCDDGNNAPGDGCSPTCQMEPGVLVSSACPSSAGFAITRTGTFSYTGNTATLANNMTSCGAGGPEQGIAGTITVAGTHTITFTVDPTGAVNWDPVVRHGGDCTTLNCTDTGGPNVSESWTFTFTDSATPTIVVDGKGGQNSGPWTLIMQVM